MDSSVTAVSKDEPEKHPNYFKIAVGVTVLAVVLIATVNTTDYLYAKTRSYDNSIIDFDARPTLSASHRGKDTEGRQNSVRVKAVNTGELEKAYGFLRFLEDTQPLHAFYKSEDVRAKADEKLVLERMHKVGDFHYPVSLIGGRSTEMFKEGLPYDFHVCVVQSKQTGIKSLDGRYYLFTDDMPVFAKVDLVDFAIKSHEGGHCYFKTFDSRDEVTTEHVDYKKALMEVAGDLASTLDYARLTGTLDLYTDFWRPYRLSNVDDRIHQTAWALDVLLKDKSIDLDALTRKGPDEIGPMVTYLMEKNFADANGEYNPIDSPASLALSANLRAQRWVDDKSPTDTDLKEKLKSDIAQSMVDHREKWFAIAPDDATTLFERRLVRWSKAFDIDLAGYTPSKFNTHQDRLDSKRPMGVLEYLTGKDYPL
ncbi:hypothetical protein [Pseudomonas sp. PLMAX]|uniref:hypothetical protein n=1 Tax=Pseudomonas sp. PLMAX TaxID=2201998 RepID=UPI0038BB5C3A